MHTLFQSLTIIPPALRAIFDAAALAALAIFALASLGRMSIWLRGEDKDSGPIAGRGLLGALWLTLFQPLSPDCLFARRVFSRSKVRGVMLMLISWSFIVLWLGVLISLAEAILPASRAPIDRLQFLVAPVMDIAGGLLLVGLLMALARRYLFRPVKTISVAADGVVLWLFAVTVLLGFMLEGVRLSGSGWLLAQYWPVGAVFGEILSRLAGGGSVYTRWYTAVYLAHAAAGLALIAYLPFSKLFHLFAAQITTAAARQRRVAVGGKEGVG
ncbi:MAG TPA: respiratory nitrate reductase subunit gamma [Anaerolineae bacterium]|nr:respiratory nitrate reductase subunit gamma [Anaerolineae bacterium]